MTTHAHGCRLVTIGVLMLARSAAIAAPAAKEDPWARVPAFTTACYSEGDPFNEKLAAAQEALTSDIGKQNQINDELKAEVGSIDPMELASRQQQYMMDHPQEAMALMQRNAQLGEDFSDKQMKIVERAGALDEEIKDLDAQYKAALDKAFDPLRAKAADLDARAQKDLVSLGEIGYGYAPWAVKEWNELVAQGNAAYQRVCADWWAAPGPYRAWLERYRDYLVKDRIPITEEAELVGAGFMVWAVGTPERPYRSTATLMAVEDYMKQVAVVFSKRSPRPSLPPDPDGMATAPW